jgi:hypothetical protein
MTSVRPYHLLFSAVASYRFGYTRNRAMTSFPPTT